MPPALYIHCLGLNHRSAPVSLREKLAFSEAELRAVLACRANGDEDVSTGEMVILATCNRVEIYATSNCPDVQVLEGFLAGIRDIPLNEMSPHLYRHTGPEAIQHLLEVAAGLDSLVLGEPQILGQVTRALEVARGIGAAGPLLTRLFQAAIHAGKRAHTETSISRNPASVPSLAAGLAEAQVKDLRVAQIVVLGAGEMAELAVEALRKRGVERVLVVNRSHERARALAERWGAETATFESIQAAISGADILIASTGAPHALVDHKMVSAIMQTRPARPLVLIDIAVPRDIDSQVASVPNVRLFDIDNLNAHLEQSLAARAGEIPRVRAILAEERRSFLAFLETLEMLPLIADLRQQAEAIRQAELQRTLRRLPDLTDDERERVDAMTQALVKKLLEAPTHRLRAEAACPHAPEYASVARSLFGLPDEQGLCGFAGGPCPVSHPLANAAD